MIQTKLEKNMIQLYIQHFLILITILIVFLFCINMFYNMNDKINKINNNVDMISTDNQNKDILDNESLYIQGRYYHNTKTFVVFTRYMNAKINMQTAMHENVHYIVDNYKFNSDKYIEIFNKSTDFVSDYAKTKWEEDLAESVAHSFVPCFNISIIPENRRNFIKENILEKHNFNCILT